MKPGTRFWRLEETVLMDFGFRFMQLAIPATSVGLVGLARTLKIYIYPPQSEGTLLSHSGHQLSGLPGLEFLIFLASV